MARMLYLASLEPESGKSVAALWLVDLLSRSAGVVGYLRPVVNDRAHDHRLELIEGLFPTEAPDGHPLQASVHTADEVEDAMADGRSQEIFTSILAAAHDLGEHCDVVLVDGTDYTGVSSAFEFEFNARVATHLGAAVVALIAGAGRSVADLVQAVGVAEESLRNEGCEIAVTIVNRVDPELLDEAVAAVTNAHEGDAPIFVVPELPLLAAPTVAEVVDALGAVALREADAGRAHVVEDIRVLAMTLPNVLARMTEGSLIVTPGDRHDVILGTLLSHTSPNHPNIAGLVLTGGLVPEGRVRALIDDLPPLGVPIVSTDGDTFQTAQQISAVRAVLRPHHTRKIDAALALMDERVDSDVLLSSIELTRTTRVTPLMLEHQLIERARSDRRHIVLPEGTDPRILEATQILRDRGVADITLLGDVDEVRAKAASLGVDLDGVPVLDPRSSEHLDHFAATYAELRAHRNVPLDQAHDVMQDVSYFGTMMVHLGLVDGMVSGAAHTTGHTIRPAFEFIRTRPGVAIVSSVFLMALADRVLVYGDCAVNPNPDADMLADIAISSAATAQMFGIEPRVAMLSYSTGESGTGSDVDAVRRATGLVRERAPDLKVEGPIQYDAAIDASVARAKMPDSAVAGKATVFIFPDLNTGNNTYKAVQRSAGALAIGPVLQGLRKPVNDLSRGCLVPDVVNTVAITAIQAQEAEKHHADTGTSGPDTTGEASA